MSAASRYYFEMRLYGARRREKGLVYPSYVF